MTSGDRRDCAQGAGPGQGWGIRCRVCERVYCKLCGSDEEHTAERDIGGQTHLCMWTLRTQGWRAGSGQIKDLLQTVWKRRGTHSRVSHQGPSPFPNPSVRASLLLSLFLSLFLLGHLAPDVLHGAWEQRRTFSFFLSFFLSDTPPRTPSQSMPQDVPRAYLFFLSFFLPF